MSTPFFTASGAQALAQHRQYDVLEAREVLTDIIARLDDLGACTGGGLGLMFRGRAKSAREQLGRLDGALSGRDRLIFAGFIRQNLDVIERAER